MADQSQDTPVLDTIAVAADPGFLLLQGQCASSTTYSSLFAKLGSPGSGSCGAGQWPLPDGRGKVVAMLDSGTSNQLNIVCTSTSLGSVCGVQQNTLLTGNIPTISGTTGAGSPHAHSVFIRDPQHQHSTGSAISGLGGLAFAAGGGGVITTTGVALTGVHANSVSGGLPATDDITASENAHTHSVSLGAASPTSFNIVQPTLMLNRQIKY